MHQIRPTNPVDGSTTHRSEEMAAPARGRRNESDVVVVGAGLAGLTAAVTAARAGASVTLLDSGRPGGRARTTVVDPGVVFNAGPRALYRGGPGWQVLAELGIDPVGEPPLGSAGHVTLGGRSELMPATPGRLLRTGALGWRSKVAVGRLLGAIDKVDVSSLQGRTLGEWARSTLGRPDAVALVLAVARLATYVDDPEHMDAGAAVAQLQLVLGGGVLYLDDGFGQLVEALQARAVAAGVRIVDHTAVRSIRSIDSGGQSAGIERGGDPGGPDGDDRGGPDGDDRGARWMLEVGDGEHTTPTVVLATGTPAAAGALSPVPLDTAGVGEPVVAACLELAVRGEPATPFLLGIDEPLYLSQHSPPASLAPDGISVVHVMRYGVTEADADREALWRHARAAGIDEGAVVAQRFLRRMVVTGGAPLARAGGLSGRPGVAIDDAPGLFLAGDWVGEHGLLSDAAMASGAEAGRLAALAAAVASGSAGPGAGRSGERGGHGVAATPSAAGTG